MDPRLIEVLVIVGLVFIFVGKLFFSVFLNPQGPGGPRQPGRPGGTGRQLEDFLEELRRPMVRPEEAERGAGSARDEARMEEQPAPMMADTPLRRPTRPARPVPEPVTARPASPAARRRPSPPPVSLPVPAAPTVFEQAQEAAAEEEADSERRQTRQARGMVLKELGALKELKTLAHRDEEDRDRDTVEAASSHFQLLGADLETAVVLREVLGPPRAFRYLGRRSRR